MQEEDSSLDLSMGDFAVSKSKTKSVIPRLIRMLVLATRKNKLDYGSLRYIHRQVIKRSKLAIPRPSKKLYNLPTSEEMDRFFSSIDDPQVKLLFGIIQNCGLRVSEACSIEVSKIDFSNQTIFITGKGNKDRIVPITSKVAERIQLFLSGRKHHYLFESKLATKFSPRRVEQICQVIRNKAGITKRITPHSFRHLYITSLGNMGVDPSIRALVCGHQNIKTQDIYSHLSLSGCKPIIIEALEKLENQRIFK